MAGVDLRGWRGFGGEEVEVEKGFLHCGGKCAASGRNDGFTVVRSSVG
jgi:hypothetical protein